MKQKTTTSDVRSRLGPIVALAVGVVLADAPSAQAQTVVEGTVEWARRASLGVPVTGVVARVEAEPGERVESGRVLVALDPGRFSRRWPRPGRR